MGGVDFPLLVTGKSQRCRLVVTRPADPRIMHFVIRGLFLLSLVLPARQARPAEAGSLADAQGVLEKWVETRQLVSRTQAQWENDKETLNQTVALLERELQSVQSQAGSLGTNSVQVEKERGQAEALLQTSNAGLERVRNSTGEIEGRIRAVVPRLPAPLQDILKPLLARLPGDPGATRMSPGERMQVVIAVLNEIDKFNNSVTVFSEKRRGERGEDIAVESVYLGLGAAYFVNEVGDFAGSGRPAASGWEWAWRARWGWPPTKPRARWWRRRWERWGWSPPTARWRRARTSRWPTRRRW